LSGVTNNGTCITNSINDKVFQSSFDNPITFGENKIYTCKMNYNYLQFEKFCNENEFKNFLIFNLPQKMKIMGKVSKSNINTVEDWVIINNNITLTNSTFNNVTKSCTFPHQIYLNIIYTEGGFVDNPQNYILSANLYSKSE
jgi:hypothetical protein